MTIAGDAADPEFPRDLGDPGSDPALVGANMAAEGLRDVVGFIDDAVVDAKRRAVSSTTESR